MATYDMRVKGFLLPLIVSGEKDLEVKIASPRFAQIHTGDLLDFSPTCHRRVKAIRNYPNFVAMLKSEKHVRILPGYSEQYILLELQRLYSRQQESLGVIVFELEIV